MKTILVYTSKPPETIFTEGGTGDWAASKNQIIKCKYVVITKSDTLAKHFPSNNIEKGSAFLIGKISGVSDSPNNKDRYIINFEEYADINLSNAWHGNRNPVSYINIKDLEDEYPNFLLDNLDWKKFPKEKIKSINTVKPLTINEAKQGIAKALDIDPGCIEIKINT